MGLVRENKIIVQKTEQFIKNLIEKFDSKTLLEAEQKELSQFVYERQAQVYRDVIELGGMEKIKEAVAYFNKSKQTNLF